MKLFACHMQAPSLDWLLSQTPASTMLGNWIAVLTGQMYNILAVPVVVHADPGQVIASNLNSIIMNVGTIWNTPQTPFVIQDPTQGCLAARALVPWPVILLFTVVTATTCAITAYWLVLTVRIRIARKTTSAEYRRAVEDQSPNGLTSWMQEATRRFGGERRVEKAWASNWCFGPLNRGTEGIGLMYVGETRGESEPLTGEMAIKRKPIPNSTVEMKERIKPNTTHVEEH
jgi:hypothetical protein